MAILNVKIYFKRRKIVKVFMTHTKDSFQVTFDSYFRKMF